MLLAAVCQQVEGEWKIEEFASGSDEDDYIITITATGSGAEQVRLPSGHHRLCDVKVRCCVEGLVVVSSS